MFDKQTALQPVITDSAKSYSHVMRFVRTHFIRPADSLQPKGFCLPERLWQRQSALIMSMQETRKDD
ncbi:MAG: hypothetical protein ABW104_04530 [Candidatus Thiodiazotropha sp. 6PLUC2]